MANRAIRAFLANLSSRPPLIFRMQWNPADIKESRKVNYSDIEIGGYQAPVQVFSSGGATTYNFQIMLDSTPYSNNTNIFRVNVAAIGINSAIDTLKSFTYPQTDKILRFRQEDMVGEPPVCYFGLGPRVLRGRIRNLSIAYKLYSPLLVPQQATVDVEFVADEYGIWAKINAISRKITSGLNPLLGGI